MQDNVDRLDLILGASVLKMHLFDFRCVIEQPWLDACKSVSCRVF